MRTMLEISRELSAIAQAGLAFTQDPFDKERFERLASVAGELLRDPARSPDFAWPAELGYPTPKVDVRGAVFQDERVLLVQEASTRLWTLPGGWADLSLSPAQNVEKECREESGYEVRARAVTSVLDRDQAGYPPHPHAIYKLTFLCELIGGAARASIETTAVDFFPLDALPPLDRGRTSETEIRRARAFLLNPQQPAAFN